MIAGSQGSICNILSKYRFSFETDESVTCLICKELMTDACQSFCGCQFCYQCVVSYTASGDRFCPGNRMYCNDEYLSFNVNVLRSPMLNKKISKVTVNCPNESCECSFELIALEEHLRLCTKKPMECPYIALGCNTKDSNKDAIETHLHRETLSHTEMLMELIKNMKDEINGLKYMFNTLKLENASLKEELGIVKSIIEMKVDSEIREMKTATNKHRQEIEQLNDTVFNLRNDDLFNNTLDIATLKDESENKKKIISSMKEELREIKNEFIVKKIETLHKKETQYEKELLESSEIELHYMTRIVNDPKESEKEMIEMTKTQIDDCEVIIDVINRISHTVNSDFVWTIDQCSNKISTRLYSDSFYSNNYKLCLGVEITSCDNIWFCCWIMKGDFDDKLQWPMRQTVTLSIIDQLTLCAHKSFSYNYDTYRHDKRAFDRPNKDKNDQYIGGSKSSSLLSPLSVLPSFIKYSKTKNQPSLIVDDCIILTCKVSES